MAATVAVTLLFASTPFLLAPISEVYGVSEGMASAVSVVQVGAFAVVNFLFPRFVRPSGRALRVGAAGFVLFNALSIPTIAFPVLLGFRLLAGVCAGVMTWLAWTSAMTRTTSMAAVASTGPVTGLVAAPLVAAVSGYGLGAVFGLMTIAAIPAMILVDPVPGRKRAKGVISGSRSNRILLLSLGLSVFFGSSLFINQALVARDIHGLTALQSSFAYSLNGLGALVGARLAIRHRHPGWFFASIGPAALLTVIGPAPFFYLGMAYWGFAFWMAVPGIMRMLVDRSLQPSERAGDAQGVMALGRTGGPMMGGMFVDVGGLTGLAVTASIGLTLSGAIVIGVQEGRDRLPPTDPSTIDQSPDDG